MREVHKKLFKEDESSIIIIFSNTIAVEGLRSIVGEKPDFRRL